MCSFLWMKCLRLLPKEYKCLIKGISTNNFVSTNKFVTNPLFLTDNIEHQPKSNKKYITFYTVFPVLKVLLIKICKIQSLYLLVLDVSSTDIIFHKFLTLHSTLTGKRFSSKIFLFHGFTQVCSLSSACIFKNMMNNYTRTLIILWKRKLFIYLIKRYDLWQVSRFFFNFCSDFKL